MTIFPNGPKAPSPFRQNILQQFHGGAGALQSMEPAGLGTAVSQPTSAVTAREPESGLPASACYYRKPLPNPQPSGLGCWHLPISPPLFHTMESAGEPLGIGRGAGRQQSLFILSNPDQHQDKPICLCLSLSIFHCSRCSSSRDQQYKKEITRCSWTVCY